jgi:hypothetical protein
LPQVNPLIVVGVIAIAVGFGAASLVAAFRGEHLDETPYGRHRAAAVLVALGYLGLAALIVVAVTNAGR